MLHAERYLLTRLSSIEIWAVRWSEHNVLHPNSPQGLYIGLYFAIGAVQLMAWTGAALYITLPIFSPLSHPLVLMQSSNRSFFIIAIAEKSADRCHVALLDTVLGFVSGIPLFHTQQKTCVLSVEQTQC